MSSAFWMFWSQLQILTEQLNNWMKMGRQIVQMLRELADSSTKIAGNKWCHSMMDSLGCMMMCFWCQWPQVVGTWKDQKLLIKRQLQHHQLAPAKFTQKENATLTQRIEILDWYHRNGKNQSATVKHFRLLYPNLQIKQPLISLWVKEEAKWCTLWEQSGHQSNQTAKRTQQTEHPKVTEMMLLWVLKAMGDGILLTGDVLQQKWITFADLAGIPEDYWLKLSNGWLTCFKEQNNLMEWK